LVNSSKFSARSRKTILEKMEKTPLDILVIGGGITGSGIALDAISRGLSVGLIEKQDFASGTSSRSGKLIHGGLKYLKSGDLSLVREVGRERAIVYNNARHLVRPIQMLFPIVKNGSFNKFTLKMGLSTYDRLAGVKKDERHFMLSKNDVFSQEPLLNREIVSGGGMYIEYRTDDSRLTLEVAKTAFEKGALITNYTEMTEFIKDDQGKIIGIVVEDKITNKTYKLYAKYIVNASGPWVDKVRSKDGVISGKRLHLTKGIHLVVPFEKLPVNESIYFDVKGRMIAVVPRDGCSYIGSTETDYYDDINNIRVEQDDVDYLLDCINGMFPSVNLSEKDITSSWAGVRPLIHEEGKPPAEMSRKDEIFESESGLVTIAGGKLTGYRKMAERVIDYVMEKGEFQHVPTQTESIKLTGGNFNSNLEINELISKITIEFNRLNVNEEIVKGFVYRYGSNTPSLFKIAEELSTSSSNNNVNDILIASEAIYSIENEMSTHLTDFFDRRTGYLLFHRKSITEMIEIIVSKFTETLAWDPEQVEYEMNLFNEEYLKTLTFLGGKVNK
jgi:glycerol-3-phosphate dehydrogenase